MREVAMHDSGIEDERVFLEKAFETGMAFSRMIDEDKEGYETSD